MKVKEAFENHEKDSLPLLSSFYDTFNRITLYESKKTLVFTNFNEYILSCPENSKLLFLKFNMFYKSFFNENIDNFYRFVENMNEFLLRIPEISQSEMPAGIDNFNSNFLSDIKY